MNHPDIDSAAAAIAYIETHLEDRLRLEDVARAACYSKCHLHRVFTAAVGLTPHDYIRRRQLTEAARRLASSADPILDIALGAGYESQRAFGAAFKAMYKRTPLEFRRQGRFYPLQLRLPLTPPGPFDETRGKPARAVPADLPDWMALTGLVIDGFPGLDEASHRRELGRAVETGQALVLRDRGVLVGAAAFSRTRGSIGFLAVHPQYRRRGAGRTLLEALRREFPPGQALSITTFREGDRADTGQRSAYRRLGFTGAGEFLTEFGYPTQRLVLSCGGSPE